MNTVRWKILLPIALILALIGLTIGLIFSSATPAHAQGLAETPVPLTFTPTPTPGPVILEEPQPAPPAPTRDILADILSLATQFGSLLGVAALVAAAVNLLKLTPLISDGDTGPWYAGLSLAAFLALVYFKVFVGLDTTTLDSRATQLATILLFIAGYLAQLKFGQDFYEVLKKLKIPGISMSFEKKTVDK